MKHGDLLPPNGISQQTTFPGRCSGSNQTSAFLSSPGHVIALGEQLRGGRGVDAAGLFCWSPGIRGTRFVFVSVRKPIFRRAMSGCCSTVLLCAVRTVVGAVLPCACNLLWKAGRSLCALPLQHCANYSLYIVWKAHRLDCELTDYNNSMLKVKQQAKYQFG